MHKWVVAVLAAAMQAGAVAAAPESRTATPEEQASFFDWYNIQQQESRGLLRPQFNVTLEGGKRGKRGKRRVTATVDGPAQRAVLPLCRQPRAVYEYDPRAGKAARWREAGPPQTLVWIYHQPQCGAQPDTPVRLSQPLAEMDILMLLQNHPAILGSARLLMAGNTSCAPSRSRGYRLTGLDRGKDGLPVLVFENDIAGEARVAVRRTRNELLPWSVTCPGPRR
ncbi:hypothetical protein [Pseudoduganella lutea]|uniref:Uncharacterized protein n=1 Tax=Pseudoduganella lutea TaxID=321985 RepID=A0A4P6KVX3_9BURK|nr:hypothetical protein [Pseudoduganella lutea]QBE63036.1 hypothetical protein EWM63_08660 [Pseudoduganella lutea]